MIIGHRMQLLTRFGWGDGIAGFLIQILHRPESSVQFRDRSIQTFVGVSVGCISRFYVFGSVFLD
jgi:hypothetical protein